MKKENAQHFTQRIDARRERAQPAGTQDTKQPYASMGPVEQYLMDGDAKIVLARSASGHRPPILFVDT